jgi:phosphoglucomutase
MAVEVVDPVAAYVALMQKLFDFDASAICFGAISPCASTPCTR